MVFTQYTDTMDFLREELMQNFPPRDVLLRSRRRGPPRTVDWRVISREKTKRRFREGRAEILLCTDAAAEGLNFQFCGALINYDMPWNPMRVEQRIGRIDRLGQQHPEIRIVNLHYEDTVEADVYMALRRRINLFQSFVGRLQPILARLPRAITEVALGPTHDRERARANLVSGIAAEVTAAEQSGFDLDEVTAAELEEPERPPAALRPERPGRPAGSSRSAAPWHPGQGPGRPRLVLAGPRHARPGAGDDGPRLLRAAPRQYRALVTRKSPVPQSRFDCLGE
jgi:hypothetical protein